MDEQLLLASAEKTGRVVTVEEHSVIGGLGSAVCDVLCGKYPAKVLKIGMDDTFGESGTAQELLEKYGLSAQRISDRIKHWIK